MAVAVDRPDEKCSAEFEDALDLAGTGWYTYWLLASCSLLLLGMYLDVFGLSVALPAAACDLDLTTTQRALLSALPLVGVMCMSWCWGLAADMLGRRLVLLGAMSVGWVLSVAACLAPGFNSLCALKFFSAAFTASANAAGFVLVGEMTPRSHRNMFLFVMASITMFTQFTIAAVALPILPLPLRVSMPWSGVVLLPWRLLLLALTLPTALGLLMLCCCCESVKLRLARGACAHRALLDMQRIYSWNTFKPADTYKVRCIYLDDASRGPKTAGVSLARRMWHQTSPLFRAPLLRHTLIVYYILLTAYMTSTGFTMWVPTLTNLYFDGSSREGATFCEVVGSTTNTTAAQEECGAVEWSTLHAVMVYSGASGCLNLVLSCVTARVGRRRLTLLVFAASCSCGCLLYVVRAPALSLALFYGFLYVCLVLGAVNSYIVELYPTHLRGMATCLSVMVARGTGFLSVNVIAQTLHTHCPHTIAVFIALVASGGAVAFLLPADNKKTEQQDLHKPA